MLSDVGDILCVCRWNCCATLSVMVNTWMLSGVGDVLCTGGYVVPH